MNTPNTPWAILLVKFSDDDSEPYVRKRYEEIFTSAGSGKWNMVDYFRDMSHGKLDLKGSKVFGWYTLDKKQSDYTGSRQIQQADRNLSTGREPRHLYAAKRVLERSPEVSSHGRTKLRYVMLQRGYH
jgi:M6 family metalloprotease-like protein